MKKKRIRVWFLVVDLPTFIHSFIHSTSIRKTICRKLQYKLIFKLQTENLDKFLSIVPMLGTFYQQMSYIYVICKRFLGYGISNLSVTAGVERSVDQVLIGKNYRWRLQCMMLWRDALIHKRLRIILDCSMNLSQLKIFTTWNFWRKHWLKTKTILVLRMQIWKCMKLAKS